MKRSKRILALLMALLMCLSLLTGAVDYDDAMEMAEEHGEVEAAPVEESPAFEAETEDEAPAEPADEPAEAPEEAPEETAEEPEEEAPAEPAEEPEPAEADEEAVPEPAEEPAAEDADALPMAADGDAYTYESSNPYITTMPQDREDVDQAAVAALERMAFTDFGYDSANTQYFYAKTVDYSALSSLTFKLLMDVPQDMDDLHLFVYGFNNNQSMGTNMGLAVVSDGVSVTMTNENGLNVISLMGAVFLLAWGPNSGGPGGGPGPGFYLRDMEDNEIPADLKAKADGYEHYAGYAWTADQDGDYSVDEGSYGRPAGNDIDRRTSDYAAFTMKDGVITDTTDAVRLWDSPDGAHLEVDQEGFRFVRENGVDEKYYILLAWNDPVCASDVIESIEVDDVTRYITERNEMHGFWVQGSDDWDNSIEWDRVEASPKRIVVTLKDGSVIEGSFGEIIDAIRDEYGDYDFNVFWTSEETPYLQWTAGDHEAEFGIDDLSVTYGVKVLANPIVKVEVDPVTRFDTEVIDWRNGPGSSFKIVDSEPGLITVTLTDNTVIAGNLWNWDGEPSVCDQLLEILGGDFDDYTLARVYDDQMHTGTKWGVGEHTATLTILGVTAEYKVTVVANPITSLTVDGITRLDTDTYEQRGYYDEQTDQYDDSLIWYAIDAYPQNITVVTAKGTFEGYPYEVRQELEAAYATEGYTFKDYCVSDQSPTVVWTAGNTYKATFYMAGFEAQYDVIVQENPITSLTVDGITRLDTDTYEQRGYYDEQTDQYDDSLIWYAIDAYPQNITVVTAKGTFEGYPYEVRQELEAAYAKEGYTFEDHWESDQSPTVVWTAGNTYQATFSLSGFEAQYDVIVKENPIAAVRVSGITRMESDRYTENGYYDSDINEWVEVDGGWKRLDCWPWDAEITVTLKNGKVFTGETDEVRDELRTYLEFEPDMYWSNDERPGDLWTAGEMYEATFTVAGVSCRYPVTVVANPVKDVKILEARRPVSSRTEQDYYIDAETYEMVETKTWNAIIGWPFVIQIETDKGTFTGDPATAMQQMKEAYPELSLECHSVTFETPDDPWDVGDTGKAMFYVCGKGYEFDIPVVADPVISGSVQPVEVVDSPENYVPLPGFDEESGQFVWGLFDGLDVGPREVSVTIDDKTYEIKAAEGDRLSVIERLEAAVHEDFPYLDVLWDSEQTPGNIYGLGEHKAWLVIDSERIEYTVIVTSPEVAVQADKVDLTGAAADEIVSGDLKKTEFNSAEKIVDALDEEVQNFIESTFFTDENAPTVTYDLYDAKAVLLDENGDVQEDGNGDPVEASAEELPSVMYLILPYPQGVNMDNWNDYEIIVLHMIGEGENAGTIERLEATPTAGGMVVALKSLSPIYVAAMPQTELLRHGDINGDGFVNLADAVRLMRYLVSEPDSVELAYNGNVNSSEDGKVNAADLMRLMRFLNGEDVAIY